MTPNSRKVVSKSQSLTTSIGIKIAPRHVTTCNLIINY